MTKGELVDRVSTNTGLSKKQTRKALDVTLDAIGGALSRGEEVNSRGSESSRLSSAAREMVSTPAPASGSRSPPDGCRSSRPALA